MNLILVAILLLIAIPIALLIATRRSSIPAPHHPDQPASLPPLPKAP